MLVSGGHVTQRALQQALSHQARNRIRVGQSLVELGLCDEVVLSRTLAEQHGLDFVDLDRFPVDRSAAAKLPLRRLKQQFMVPLMIVNDELLIAVSSPPKKSTLVALTYEAGLRTRPVVATVSAIARALTQLEPAGAGSDELQIEI